MQDGCDQSPPPTPGHDSDIRNARRSDWFSANASLLLIRPHQTRLTAAVPLHRQWFIAALPALCLTPGVESGEGFCKYCAICLQSAKHETNEAREVEYEGLRVCRFGRKLKVTWKSCLNTKKIIFVVFHCIIDCQHLFLSCEKSNYFCFFKEACRVEWNVSFVVGLISH